MQAKEGPGVFFTHSMDARQIGSGDGIFHSPVPVVYGDKPAHVAVAARGDDLVVAYEDPNGERSMVGLALSRTMGHIFEQRLVVSMPDLPARDPLVVLRGDSVMVQWAERPDSVQSGGRVAVRSARGESVIAWLSAAKDYTGETCSHRGILRCEIRRQSEKRVLS